MAVRIGKQGAPSFYGNWLDESVNRLLKSVAAGSHSSVWEVSVLTAYRAWKGTADAKRRRA
eukprot:8470764-Lingulodinium_polyedra.AAC.1